MNGEHIYFPNIGYTSIVFDEYELLPLKDEIFEIQKKNFHGTKYNDSLAGNIEKEYKLVKCKEYIQNLLAPICVEYDKEFGLTKNINILTKNCPIILDLLWVNFQTKGEFNPYHTHSGVYSFVIWIDVPYDMEIEMEKPSSKNSNKNCPGHFEFSFTNCLGKISYHKIPADRKFKNQGLLFPSNLPHCVYPFFTSDDYRISVSGNFKLQV